MSAPCPSSRTHGETVLQGHRPSQGAAQMGFSTPRLMEAKAPLIQTLIPQTGKLRHGEGKCKVKATKTTSRRASSQSQEGL